MGSGEMDERELREACAEAAFSDIAPPIIQVTIEQAKAREKIPDSASSSGHSPIRLARRAIMTS
ncbi:hypothetical protein PWR63_30715 [Paraburkholderia sp. A2WS-5]|uniref:hypothetical protein n=1 Tax=unclassified Paraburkholderia TaxID=2615204 RepID=UPI003B7FE0C6